MRKKWMNDHIRKKRTHLQTSVRNAESCPKDSTKRSSAREIMVRHSRSSVFQLNHFSSPNGCCQPWNGRWMGQVQNRHRIRVQTRNWKPATWRNCSLDLPARCHLQVSEAPRWTSLSPPWWVHYTTHPIQLQLSIHWRVHSVVRGVKREEERIVSANDKCAQKC